ncbi:MAG: universal stress protein [Verrucomicrobiae bacterium]|nr:universal stress protein [Verrucomicrobiae bacterium]
MSMKNPAQFNKILVPLDFSPTSQKALNRAIALAQQSKASLILIHVVTFTMVAGAEQFTAIDWYQRLQDEAKKSLKKIQNKIPASVRSEIILDTGNPFDLICRAAKKKNADLIVISTHGFSGLKHVLLGSTAERVIRHAPCPVLVVR